MAKFLQLRQKYHVSCDPWRVDPHSSLWAFPERIYFLDGIRNNVECRGYLCQQGQTCLGRRNGTGGTVQQSDAEPLLQRTQGMAER